MSNIDNYVAPDDINGRLILLFRDTKKFTEGKYTSEFIQGIGTIYVETETKKLFR